MEENKVTLTDEEVDAIVETLEENKPEDAKIVQDIINSEESENESVSEKLDSYLDDIDEDFENIEKIDPDEYIHMPITDDMIKSSDLNKDNNFTNEQVVELIKFINSYEEGKDDEVYDNLPPFIKKEVDAMLIAAGGKMTKKEVCKIIVDNMIKDIRMDKAFLDLNTSIKDELKIPSMTELYAEITKENFEVKLREYADKIRDEFPERANAYDSAADTYKKTYTFEVLIDSLNDRKVRQYIKNTNKYNKMVNHYKNLYIGCKFKPADINEAYKTIISTLPVGEEYAKKFIMLICRVAERFYNPNKINDHVFIYYTIQNIIMIRPDEMFDMSKRTPLYESIVDGINKTVEAIKAHEKK